MSLFLFSKAPYLRRRRKRFQVARHFISIQHELWKAGRGVPLCEQEACVQATLTGGLTQAVNTEHPLRKRIYVFRENMGKAARGCCNAESRFMWLPGTQSQTSGKQSHGMQMRVFPRVPLCGHSRHGTAAATAGSACAPGRCQVNRPPAWVWNQCAHAGLVCREGIWIGL